MPRFINQEQIPMKLRKPHLDRYKRQLRDALMNPGMSPTDKVKVRVKLAAVGMPKVYGPISVPGDEPKKSGAVQTTEVEPEVVSTPEQTRADLIVMTHDDLMVLAESEGADVKKSWSKGQKADAILLQRATKSP